MQFSAEDKQFRKLLILDLSNKKTDEIEIYKDKYPVMWANIEKYEVKGITPPLYNGEIIEYNGIDIVVFGFQTIEQAYEQQKQKAKERKVISKEEALKKIKKCEGYQTDLNTDDGYSYQWLETPADFKKIRFRYYHGRKGFEWSDWYTVFSEKRQEQ